MTGDKYQAQEIVPDIVGPGFHFGGCFHLPALKATPQFLMLLFGPFVPPQMINRPMLRGCHQPGAGITRDAIARPLFECRDESILRQFFGHPDVADNPRDSGDQAGGFDPPDGVDGQMNVRDDHCTDHSIPGCIRASKADGASESTEGRLA
jgi:hypothetical protein